MLFRSCLPLLCLLLLPIQAQGHKIHVFAWVSGNVVTVESGFSGNRPLQNGTVTVKDKQSNAILVEGTGDNQGIFTFSIPEKAKEAAMDLLIVVSGGEGHQGQWLITAGEYLPASSGATSTPVSATGQKMDNGSVAGPDRVAAETACGNEELKRMVQELLAEELAPIRRSLAKAEDRTPDIHDIMGGIGYLLGLAGLIAWLKNRPQPAGNTDD